MGYLDADGYLYIADRKSDMVISGGVNIYPAEIEAVLMTHARRRGLRRVRHTGRRVRRGARRRGPTQAGATLPRRRAGLSERAKSPATRCRASVTFHDELPREDSGKIFKRLLREPYWRDAGRKI